MSETFAASARRLAGASTRLFGWPPGWFWEATPAELASILLDDSAATEGITRAQLDAMMKEDSHG